MQEKFNDIGGDFVDYYEIGQKVRKFRKEKGYSQEELAELVGISVTHMSHIETGNTKLSLPVFVSLAEALDVRTDELLHNSDDVSRERLLAEIGDVLCRCDENGARVLLSAIKSIKSAMDKYM